MKTPILKEMYLQLKNNHPEYFLQDTKATEHMQKLIEKNLQKSEKVDLMNLIYDYANEYRDIGFINGFRICFRLINELSQADKMDFLEEMLLEDMPDYWEYLNKKTKLKAEGGEYNG